MPKPQSPLKESSQENPPTTFPNHDSLQPHSFPLGDSCDTNVGQAFIPPQSVNQTQLTQPLFPHLLINPHVVSVLHAQTPPSPQGDNQTQPPLPPSPSREMLINDINQLQYLSNLLAMHLSQHNTPSSPYSPNLPHTVNLNQVKHQVSVSNLRPDYPPIIFHIGYHWLNELVFMGKEKRDFLTKHIIWLVDDFDAWNAFPWSEYMWEKFYNRTVNVVSRHTEHHLAQLKKNLNFNATYNLYGFAWAFKAWMLKMVHFFKMTKVEKNVWNINGMCGDTEDGTFVDRVVGKICPKTNRMSVDDRDGVLDSQSDDGDGVLDSQTKDVIEEASMLPTMSSNNPQAGNAAVSKFFAEFHALKKEVLLIKKRKDDEFDELTKRFSNDCNPKKSDGGVSIEENPNFSSHHNDSSNHIGGVSSKAKASSSSTHPGNDEDVSHLDDNIEIDGPNAKDRYSNSQHHLHLLIKALGTKIENPSIDSVVVVPPKVDDPMLRTIKPKDNFDEADVDSYDDDYMSLFHDEEQHAKSSLNDLELQQEPDIVDVKDGILDQQANADKGKTVVIQETVGVTVKEQPSLGKGLGTLKFKKKNCERALRPNYVLRSTKIRKNEMAMSLKSPFGQKSDTTPVPTKRKARLNKIEDIVLLFDLEDIFEQPQIRSMNHIMTHDPFVEKALVETNEEGIARETNSLSTHVCMDWKKLDNDSLPRESIRFKRSSQVVVGRLIFWAGHERDGLTVPMCLSSIGNSLILSGSTDETDCYLFCGWSVLVDVTSLTSFTLLFVTLNYVKLLGFTMDEISLPIVENLGIQEVAGSFFIGHYKESLILLPYPDRELYHMFLA
nr:phospholipase-like protein [Tanacetum cinerariifolium]